MNGNHNRRIRKQSEGQTEEGGKGSVFRVWPLKPACFKAGTVTGSKDHISGTGKAICHVLRSGGHKKVVGEATCRTTEASSPFSVWMCISGGLGKCP